MATIRQTDSTGGQAMRAGQMLPSFELPSSRGGSGGPRFYKSRRSLVVLFLRDDTSAPARETLRDLAAHYDEYVEEEAEILAVVTQGPEAVKQLAEELRLPFPLLADADGAVHHRLASANETPLGLAVYVTDRFGEIGAAWPAVARHEDLPGHTALLEHLRFLGIQCPE
ncbi:MAG: redoxin domain-containing protein [Chloroflexota bacterium]